jgi:chemotaxis protein MotB
MVTYADMLTLLLVLFIVLFAISAVNTSKFMELKSSLASAFNNGQPSVLHGGNGIVGGEDLSSKIQIGLNPAVIPKAAKTVSKVDSDPSAAQHEVDEFKKIEASIKQSLKLRGLSRSAQYSIDERGLVVTVVTDSLVFAGNSAVLGSGGQLILHAVIPPLRGIDNQIQVGGHTNQQSVSTDPYPSGWELSSARASSVVRYLISKGPIAPSRLSAAGFSDQRPLVPASDPRSITRNRRVDIVVLSKLPAGDRAALSMLGQAASRSGG